MSPQTKDDKKHNNSLLSTSTAAFVSDSLEPVSLSQLPEDIIVYILKRLPVKSILRFKCVSKNWLSFLSSPNFVSMHCEETSNNPLNHSFIVSSIDKFYNHTKLSLLNINSTEREPISLFNPFPWLNFEKIDLVGSINGLVCLTSPQFPGIILWNPAMKIYKVIRFSVPSELTRLTTLGFSYDSVNDDYKIIRIDFIKHSNTTACSVARSEVYSVSLDSWKSVPIDFQFVLPVSKSIVVAKGIPCRMGILYQPNNRRKFTKSDLVYFDTRNGSFKHVSPPELAGLDVTATRFVEWNGNLGLIVFSSSIEREDLVDILVYDEMGMCWNNISSHGPIALKIKRPVQCSEDGVILAETPEEKLLLYDPITNGIKEFSIPGARKLSFQAYTYTESLVALKGMEKVEERNVALINRIKMMMMEIEL